MAQKAASQLTSIKDYAKAMQAGEKHYFKGEEVADGTLKEKLTSSFEADTLDALKQILASILIGDDMSRFFPDVVMCIHKASVDVKRLSYVVLTQLYPQNRDNGLMPINMLHKETFVKEALRRGDSLKVLGDLSLNEVHPFLFQLIRNGIRDNNPYVRRVALAGLHKLVDLTEFTVAETSDEVEDILKTVMRDTHLMVFSQSLLIGAIVYPEQKFMKIIHPCFFRVIENLHCFDQCMIPFISQVVAIYAQTYLASKISTGVMDDQIKLRSSIKNAFLFTLTPESTLPLVNLYLLTASNGVEVGFLVPILRRVIASSEPESRLYSYQTLSILISLHKSLPISKEVVCLLKLKQDDSFEVQAIKTSLLQHCFIYRKQQLCLNELISQLKTPKKALRLKVIRTLGECGRIAAMSSCEEEEQKELSEMSLPTSQNSKSLGLILDHLIHLLKLKDSEVLTEAIIALHKMIVSNSEQSHAIILYCVKMLDKIQSARAKATMIYLLKRFVERFPTLAKETFRRLVKSFLGEQGEESKMQILNLGCVIMVNNKDDSKVAEIFKYLLKIAFYDKSFLLRQKARNLQYLFDLDDFDLLKRLFSNPPIEEEALIADVEDRLSQMNKETLLSIGSFAHPNSTKINAHAATDQEQEAAYLLRREHLDLTIPQQQETPLLTALSNKGVVTSMSSSSSSTQAHSQNETQNFKKPHFTLKDPDSLKKDYEDFFTVSEPPPTQVKPQAAGSIQSIEGGLNYGGKDDPKAKKDEDDYDFY